MIFGKDFCRLTKETLFRGAMETDKDKKMLKGLKMILNRKTLITKSIFFNGNPRIQGKVFQLKLRENQMFISENVILGFIIQDFI